MTSTPPGRRLSADLAACTASSCPIGPLPAWGDHPLDVGVAFGQSDVAQRLRPVVVMAHHRQAPRVRPLEHRKEGGVVYRPAGMVCRIQLDVLHAETVDGALQLGKHFLRVVGRHVGGADETAGMRRDQPRRHVVGAPRVAVPDAEDARPVDPGGVHDAPRTAPGRRPSPSAHSARHGYESRSQVSACLRLSDSRLTQSHLDRERSG